MKIRIQIESSDKEMLELRKLLAEKLGVSEQEIDKFIVTFLEHLENTNKKGKKK